MECLSEDEEMLVAELIKRLVLESGRNSPWRRRCSCSSLHKVNQLVSFEEIVSKVEPISIKHLTS